MGEEGDVEVRESFDTNFDGDVSVLSLSQIPPASSTSTTPPPPPLTAPSPPSFDVDGVEDRFKIEGRAGREGEGRGRSFNNAGEEETEAGADDGCCCC